MALWPRSLSIRIGERELSLRSPFRVAPATRSAAQTPLWLTSDLLLSGLSSIPAGDEAISIPHTPEGRATATAANVWALRCVSVRAQAVGSLPWVIRNANGTVISRSQDRSPTHPAARAIKRVPARQNANLFALWEMALCVHGEAFIEKQRNPSHYVTGLRWLNPVATTPITHTGRITGFQYTGQNGAPILRPDEVVYDKLLNPYNDLRGLSPMDAALNNVNIDANLKAFIRVYFRNNTRLGLVFSPKEGELRDQDFVALSTYIKKYLAGLPNAFKPQVFNKPMDIAAVQPPTLEDQVEMIDRLSQEILVSYGVPRPIAGDVDSTTYQAHDDVLYWFYTTTVINEATDIAEAFNASAMPDFDPSGESVFAFETEAFDRVSKAKLERQAFIKARLDSGEIDLYTFQVESGNPTPDARFKGLYKVAGINGYVPADEVPNVWKSSVPLVLLDTPASRPEQVLTPPPAPVETRVDAKSFCVALDLANHPDLLALQQDVKRLIGDTLTVDWNAPDSFHVTLAYAPDCPDDQRDAWLNAVRGVPAPDLSLAIGSLNVFPGVNGHALHFRVPRNQTLLDYQDAVYQALTAIGAPLSAYSAPDQYKPHVTMGYAESAPPSVTFRAKFTVAPHGIVVWHGDNEVVYRTADDQNDEAGADGDTRTAQAALREMRQWVKFVENATDTTRSFETRAIDAGTAALIASDLRVTDGTPAAKRSVMERWQQVLEARAGNAQVSDQTIDALGAPSAALAETLRTIGYTDERIRPAVERHYLRMAAARAVQATRLDFEMKVEDMLTEAVAGTIEKTRFKTLLRAAIRTACRQVYFDGLRDGGVTAEDLDADEEEWLDAHIKAQTEYVSGLADAIFEDGRVTEAEAVNKPAMWWSKSIYPAYQEALLSAARNAAFLWMLGQREEHCHDCVAMNGQVRRLKEFHRRGVLPKADTLACNGFNCGCELLLTDEPLTRGRWPRLVGPSARTAGIPHVHASTESHEGAPL